MKILKYIFLLFTCFGLIMGCSKDEELLENQDELLKKASKKGQVPTFVVEPTGTDDTENLKNAFSDAMTAGDGSVVQLCEGEYFISFIEIREFKGKFIGMGKGKTIVTTLNNLDPVPILSAGLTTFLLKFVGGDVEMCNMSIRTPEGPLTNTDNWWIDGLVCFSARNRIYESENDYIKAKVNNVSFEASPFPGMWKSNCNTGLKAGFDSRYWKLPGGWPLSPIDITITNCVFDNFDIYGAVFSYISEGQITAGAKNNGNIFTNNSTAGYGYGASLSFWHNVNIRASLVENTINVPPYGFFGIEANNGPWLSWLQHVPLTKTSVFNIEKNELNIEGGFGGMLLKDNRRQFWPEENPRLYQLKNNKMNMSEGTFTALGSFNTSGMVIRNNKFTGNAEFGVRLFGLYKDMGTEPPVIVYNENGLMLGNNFSNAHFSETVVWLSGLTNNWTVVGGNLGESIWNDGENNIIKGFNNKMSDIPPGQMIVDNLHEMKRPIHNLKGK